MQKLSDEILDAVKGQAEELNNNFKEMLGEIEPRIKQGEAAGEGVADLKEKVQKMSQRNADLIDGIKAEVEKSTERLDEFETAMNDPDRGGRKAAAPTPGQLLAKHINENHPDGLEAAIKAGRSVSVSFPSWQKTTITDDAGSAGDLLVPYARPGIIDRGERTPSIRSLIPSFPIATDQVRFFREVLASRTDNAGSQDGQGTAKGESAFVFEDATADVQTIAHFVPAAKQILSDVPRLQAYVDNKLRLMLALEVEDQLLLGDGTNSTLNGVQNQATAFDEAGLWTGIETDITNPQRLDLLRVAILQAALAYYPVDGIVSHPTDWATIELTKETTGGYMITNPITGGGNRLWGVSVVATTAQTADNFLVGAFGLGAEVYNREAASVMVATQHSDDFTKNKVTILAEERLALAVTRPDSFITGTYASAGL